MDIRPLTRRDKAGALYYRDALVEQQIQSLVSLPDNEILAYAHIQDTASPQYIQAESVVYWIREYLHRGDQERAGDLANILLARCVKLLQINLHKLGPDLAPQAEQDVVSDLFRDIFNLESDQADFLQGRFWRDLDRRITNAFKRYIRDDKRTTSLSAGKDNELYGDDDSTEGANLPDLTMTTEQIIEDRELLKSALAAIDDRYRTAFILRHYYGWQIESKQSGEPSISKCFEKDPRTIRNWLRQAEQALREWRNEERS